MRGGTEAGPHSSLPLPLTQAPFLVSSRACNLFVGLVAKNVTQCWVVHREWVHVAGECLLLLQTQCQYAVWAKQALVAPSSSQELDFIDTVFEQRHNVVEPRGWEDADLQEKFLKIFFFEMNLSLCWEIISLCAFVHFHCAGRRDLIVFLHWQIKRDYPLGCMGSVELVVLV